MFNQPHYFHVWSHQDHISAMTYLPREWKPPEQVISWDGGVCSLALIDLRQQIGRRRIHYLGSRDHQNSISGSRRRRQPAGGRYSTTHLRTSLRAPADVGRWEGRAEIRRILCVIRRRLNAWRTCEPILRAASTISRQIYLNKMRLAHQIRTHDVYKIHRITFLRER